MIHTVYLLATGEFRQTLYGPVYAPDYDADTEGLITGAYASADYYVSDGQPVPRPTMPITAQAIDGGVRLTGVPEGTQCVHPGGEGEVNDGVVEFTAAEPGRYHLRLHCWPYKPFEYEVVV